MQLAQCATCGGPGQFPLFYVAGHPYLCYPCLQKWVFFCQEKRLLLKRGPERDIAFNFFLRKMKAPRGV